MSTPTAPRFRSARISQPGSGHPHVVHLYENDVSLIGQTSRLLRAALRAGDAVVVIATEEHREALARKLHAEDLNLAAVSLEGRYLALDAKKTLSQILVRGVPDSDRFRECIGGLIAKATLASKSDDPCVTVFGEMVALLWAEGEYEAAVGLERLWNDLAGQYPFSLQCSYPLDGFSKPEHTELLMRVCAEHSALLPEGQQSALPLGEDERLRTIASLEQRLHVLEHEKALRESEQRFRLLVEAVQDYAIFMLNPEGRIASWNIGAERIKGYKAAEILGKHFSVFYPSEDRESGRPARSLEIAAREGRIVDEGWRVRKDGSKFWANVTITALKDDSGQILGFSKVTRDVTERKLAEEALQASQQKLRNSEKSLRDLSIHLLRTQEEERRQIGRELHDSLGQYLSVLKMKLDSLKSAALRTNSDNVGDLEQCSQLMNEAVKEVRTISYLLYPPMLEEMGLKTAIPWYLDGFSQRSGIRTVFEISSDFGRLPRDVELALFRVLQESLTNVHRHSLSPEAAVRLGIAEGEFFLEVTDKGTGMPKFEDAGRDWTGSLGVGLRGMTERMHQIGGRLEISSSEKGTTVRAIVPPNTAPAAPRGSPPGLPKS